MTLFANMLENNILIVLCSSDDMLLRERALAARRYATKKGIHTIILSWGNPQQRIDGPEAARMAKHLEYSPENTSRQPYTIIQEWLSLTTQENAQRVRDILKENGWTHASIELLSSHMHLKRALKIFQEEGFSISQTISSESVLNPMIPKNTLERYMGIKFPSRENARHWAYEFFGPIAYKMLSQKKFEQFKKLMVAKKRA